MLTPDQIEARRKGVGGSDVAVILGINPWKTSHELYLEKRGEIDTPPLDSERIHFGNVLEQIVADEYTSRTGEKLQKRNEMLVHPEYSFMLANIDRKIVGRKAVFEAKTTDKYMRDGWGDTGTEEIPDHYRTQIEHYMTVTGYDEAVAAVLIGGNEFRYYPIKRDPELSDMLFTACKQFWDKVLEGIPPDIDFIHQNTLPMLKKIYPGTNGETVVLPAELSHWHRVKQDAEVEIKRYGTVVDTCKARILAVLGENAVGILPDAAYKYTRSVQKRKEYTVAASEHVQLRGSAHKEKP